MSQLYTTGYTGQDIKVLPTLLEQLNAKLCDIRFSSTSRHEQWREKSLQELLGDRYIHIPELGNESFRLGHIQIHRLGLGKLRIGQLAAENEALILMCGCKQFSACHRATVAKELEADYQVSEIANWAEWVSRQKQTALFA